MLSDKTTCRTGMPDLLDLCKRRSDPDQRQRSAGERWPMLPDQGGSAEELPDVLDLCERTADPSGRGRPPREGWPVLSNEGRSAGELWKTVLDLRQRRAGPSRRR